MSKFDPDSYRQYRPFYPAEIFRPFLSLLAARGAAAERVVADIGCGTGHSAVSFLRARGVADDCRLLGVDPDPQMLARARQVACEDGSDARIELRISWSEGTGEATGLDDSSVDGILVGSAFHWMDAARTRDEFLRILRNPRKNPGFESGGPRGPIFIFEYQFPKSTQLPELNEWIRREFNLRWKAPGQKPRGDFTQVTSALREDPRFKLVIEEKPPMIQMLTPDQLAGLLLSQSRVLHYERQLAGHAGEEESHRFRSEVRAAVRHRMKDASAEFDFRLTCATFLAL